MTANSSLTAVTYISPAAVRVTLLVARDIPERACGCVHVHEVWLVLVDDLVAVAGADRSGGPGLRVGG